MSLVAKFGGTSMKDAQAIKRSTEISRDHHANIVVVSATSGTTNKLLKIADLAQAGAWDDVQVLIDVVGKNHDQIAKDLGLDYFHELEALYQELDTLARGIFYIRDIPAKTLDRLQSIGERLSSYLMCEARKRAYPNEKIELLDARDIIVTNNHFGKAKPIIDEIAERARSLDPHTIYITQGFMGGTVEGETTTLGRGGSDYSAGLFAEAINAQTLQIWTDVAGVATTDPRLCSDALPIKEMSFKEASELAVFGAKILHPTTLQPAIRKGICVFVGSSFAAQKQGTWIKPFDQCDEKPLIRAMALKRDQTLLTLRTPKMLDTHGFLAQAFAIFDRHLVSVDAITTSEISVAMTVDKQVIHQQSFLDDLKKLGQITIEEELALVSLIGNNINHTPGLAMNIFAGLHCDDQPVNVRMICLGASRHNFCMVMEERDAEVAIKRLHRKFITS